MKSFVFKYFPFVFTGIYGLCCALFYVASRYCSSVFCEIRYGGFLSNQFDWVLNISNSYYISIAALVYIGINVFFTLLLGIFIKYIYSTIRKDIHLFSRDTILGITVMPTLYLLAVIFIIYKIQTCNAFLCGTLEFFAVTFPWSAIIAIIPGGSFSIPGIAEPIYQLIIGSPAFVYSCILVNVIILYSVGKFIIQKINTTPNARTY